MIVEVHIQRPWQLFFPYETGDEKDLSNTGAIICDTLRNYLISVGIDKERVLCPSTIHYSPTIANERIANSFDYIEKGDTLGFSTGYKPCRQIEDFDTTLLSC